MKKIIVLTSGGDAPGMNAAIRAVVRTAHYYGLQPFGSPLGYQGLVDQKLTPLFPESVANCIQYGGTILKAERCMDFYEKKTRDQCRQFLKHEAIDGIIVIGGNGSFRGAALLQEEGGPAVMAKLAELNKDKKVHVNTILLLGSKKEDDDAEIKEAIQNMKDMASQNGGLFELFHADDF